MIAARRDHRPTRAFMQLTNIAAETEGNREGVRISMVTLCRGGGLQKLFIYFQVRENFELLVII